MKIDKISSQSVTKIDYPKGLESKASSDLINQYIKYVDLKTKIKAGNTKSKAEVSGGGAKPWKQKGTGRARHGSTRSPIWRGGGITFGPTSGPSRRILMNKKMRRKAFKAILSLLAKNNQVKVAEFEDSDLPKTIREQITKEASSVNSIKLIVIDRKKSILSKAANLKNTELVNLNRFGAAQMQGKTLIIFEDEAIAELVKRLKS